MENDFWKAGNIVRLKTPAKDALRLIDAISLLEKITAKPFDEHTQQHASELWEGFTHGIIVEVLGGQSGKPAIVSLHLYDPANALIKMGPNSVPEYHDYTVEELIPWRVANADGYYLVAITKE